MGLKVLIAEACSIPTEDGPRGLAINETVDVDKETAAVLTRAGRAYYTERGDDPTKGNLTANGEDKARLKKLAASVEADYAERAQVAAVTTPAGMAALVAQQVAAALAAGAAAPAK